MKHRNHLAKYIFALTIMMSGVFIFGVHSAQALSGPTVISPKNGYILPPDTQLVVTGLVKNGSSVFLFIDGKLMAGVLPKNGKKGTASFKFKVKPNFSIGNHTIQTIARQQKVTSAYTDKITFTVPKVWPRRIDGLMVPSAQANTVPISIMIENLYTVRPQAGLAAASVVYETLAEGGIPRFLAIFARTDMPKVGPVRSARPYYVDVAKEYNATLMHAGGSRDAFNEVGRMKLRSIDALVNKTARYFFRAGPSATTHNLFTKSALLKAVYNDFKLDTVKATFQSWKFKDDPVLAKRPNEKRTLTIDFRSGSQYIVAYRYERISNSFIRYNGGKPFLDANLPKNTPVRVKNVIVQLIEKEKVLDWQKHLALQITGSGRGWLLQDGKLQQIMWRKAKVDSRTVFYYLNGREVELTRGNTWVEIVPKDRVVTWK